MSFSRTAPFTFLMRDLPESSRNSTLTCVTPPRLPVLPMICLTTASFTCSSSMFSKGRPKTIETVAIWSGMFFDEGTRSVTVSLPDATSVVFDGVSVDVTVGSFISHISTVDEIKNLEGVLSLHNKKRRLKKDEILNDDEVSLVIGKSVARPYIELIVSCLAILVHVIVACFIYSKCKWWKIILTYAGLLFVEGLFYIIIKPSGRLMNLKKGDSEFLDILLLLFKSFLPNFELETVLLNQ